jgi:hypothetical protein
MAVAQDGEPRRAKEQARSSFLTLAASGKKMGATTGGSGKVSAAERTENSRRCRLLRVGRRKLRVPELKSAANENGPRVLVGFRGHCNYKRIIFFIFYSFSVFSKIYSLIKL